MADRLPIRQKDEKGKNECEKGAEFCVWWSIRWKPRKKEGRPKSKGREGSGRCHNAIGQKNVGAIKGVNVNQKVSLGKGVGEQEGGMPGGREGGEGAQEGVGRVKLPLNTYTSNCRVEHTEWT